MEGNWDSYEGRITSDGEKDPKYEFTIYRKSAGYRYPVIRLKFYGKFTILFYLILDKTGEIFT